MYQAGDGLDLLWLQRPVISVTLGGDNTFEVIPVCRTANGAEVDPRGFRSAAQSELPQPRTTQATPTSHEKRWALRP
jgi:hypothetical protein